MYNNIPSELQGLNKWVVWRYEDVDAKKPTKVPYQSRTGRHAKVTDPNTWGTFKDALLAMETGWYSGVGFVLAADDPYTFIDLDYTEDAEQFERQKRIFEKFYRIPSPDNERIVGTGLGLALVSHIVKAHGGYLELESTLGKGSTFSIYLPMEDQI